MPSTLASLIERVRFEADLTGSSYVSDADITRIINTQRTENFDLLVSASPPDWFLTTTTITTTPPTSSYALPSNFRSIVRVMLNDTDGRLVSVMPYQESDVAAFVAPSSARTVTIEYVPSPSALVNPGDLMDGGSPGWDELCVLLGARVLLRRQRRDTQELLQAINELRARISSSAPERQLAGPLYIQSPTAWAGRGWRRYAAISPSIDAWRLAGSNIELFSLSPFYP